MFGRNNDDELSQSDASAQPAASATNATSDQPLDKDKPTSPSTDQTWQHPGAPLSVTPGQSDELATPATTSPLVIPSIPPHNDDDMPPKLTDEPDTKNNDLINLSNHELIDIKQKALGELNPLMGHLDQTPEEKFRTTMMMIQASDDQSLVKAAYEAAQNITDEKARAQALLDIVNEINYFTQHHSGN